MKAMWSYVRQALGVTLLCFGLVVCMHGGAFADAGTEAKEALESSLNGIISKLGSDEFKNDETREAVRAEIEKLIRRSFDFEEFSMRTVGPRWRTFTDEQRKKFAEAFEALLRSSYTDKLESYNGENVEYAGERASKDGSRVEVATNIIQGDKKIPVAYRMLHKGEWVVYDVLVEGISLVKNYRTQFQELLRSETPDELIHRIHLKAEEMKQANGKN
ncbi:ABC transporter substrate-binding protein [Oleidesulfovibrio sp.]|uniref:Tgt2/MlaC family protein n=1 Tax=Oleidesulfovibrio sp. TaxID=2909707 RepID=UPI003A86C41A